MSSLGMPVAPQTSRAWKSTLIVSEMPHQALALQRLFAELGHDATIAAGETTGLAYLGLRRYDLAVLDADLGYPAVGRLANFLRRDHPGTAVALLVGWWDVRTVEMSPHSDVLLYKPVHPQQLREALDRLAA